jgi:carbamoylphosphate synthase large subunit
MKDKYLKYKRKYLDLKKKFESHLITHSINNQASEEDIFYNIIFPYLKKNNICLTNCLNNKVLYAFKINKEEDNERIINEEMNKYKLSINDIIKEIKNKKYLTLNEDIYSGIKDKNIDIYKKLGIYTNIDYDLDPQLLNSFKNIKNDLGNLKHKNIVFVFDQ